MKEIPLTHGKVALVDDEDYEKVNQFKWSAYQDHKNGRWYAGYQVDHKNRDETLDNRRENLRISTAARNQQNVGKRKDNTSGFKGVNLSHGQWQARIRYSGATICLGHFSTPELAAAAYDAAALLYHKEFAVTNAMLAA